MSEQRSSVLAELDAAVESLRQCRSLSTAQDKQLVMTAGQLERAVLSGLLPAEARISLEGLLAGGGRRAFLELALSGVFRRPGRSFVLPSTVHTGNVLTLWSQRLAEAAGLTPEKVPYAWQDREPVSATQLRMLHSYVAAQTLSRRRMTAFEVRFNAMALTAMEAAPRLGEMGAQRLTHLSRDRRRIWVPCNPQRAETEWEGEWYDLSPMAARGLRRWEAVREQVISQVQGGKSALWVTLRVNGYPRPPGLPLAKDGFIRTWAIGIARANFALQGAPGWPGPVSHHLESLRKGVEELWKQSP